MQCSPPPPHTLQQHTQHSGKLELQYTGDVADSYEFGANFALGTVLKAACPKGKGIAALQWRRGKIEGKDDQAWKPGGLQVFCNTE